ncbi:MAG: tyrosine-protein phosphatase [Clostridiales bacterium]|nr:tyrosine-protein phosphatase [Clostridiales bacterium]
MRNYKKGISVFCAAVCALFVLCGCNVDKTVECKWELVDFDDSVSLHTALQTEYLADDYNNIAKYAKGDKELSIPKPVQLSWVAETKEQATVVSYTVEIEDYYNEYKPLSFETDEPSIDVYNLCVGTGYSWRVTAHLSDGRKSVSSRAYFMTEELTPRNLYVDGITNVRDLGGWETPYGMVRQGLIYRCGRLNESKRPDVVIEITQDGIDTMRDTLGIKSEIDLRMPNTHNTETGGITSSPLGEDVNYYNVPLEWDQGNYLTYNLESVKEFFSLASDESNYPFIFHCNIGTDRTGMFAFLINGLLGVSEEDLYRDYLFSNFGNIENNARTLNNIKNNFLPTINKCNGNTLREKIENCLLDIVGVSQDEIDSIKSIMLY